MPLPFPARTRYDAATYQVSSANRAAFEFVQRWPDWPSRGAVLFAAPGCGKSHLAHIWAARAAAQLFAGESFREDDAFALPEGRAAVVDDADLAARSDMGARALFHVLNRAQQEGSWVLLTGTTHPSVWQCPLNDLRTRLAAAAAFEIEPPDDALLAAALTKSFADRQLQAKPALVAFIVARIERDFRAAERLAEAMDQATLGTGKTLSFELADRLIAKDVRD
jgi:chromosomal replication initiation ATPase DnaA